MAKPIVKFSEGTREAVVSRARLTLFLSVIITAALYVVPYGHTVAYPLLLISTLVHELGHGLAAMLVGGNFERFVMFADGSGQALSSGAFNGLEHAFIAAGGLIGPAVGAAFCLIFARRTSTARYCMGTIGVLMLIAEVAVVRNPFGLAFVGIFAALCLLFAFKAGPQLVQLALVFLGVQLALSVYSRSDYLFTPTAQTAVGASPSDAQAIADAMGFAPYWFWGGLCGAFSVVVLIVGGWLFLRGARKNAGAA
ncbi:M50 family metallopeptidase [Haliangium ochraceum]|uniref:Peptidase M50 n=1 Tax=Haliangium ochraceum (strain DSM 14365 / JCM 11303 / SMP-2) TaxID=502025 RepID=D0LRU1_HALO1|nr:M50 family metallopeptidase [Haliangium ochraceum]ACY19083.1 hypothetical protein Hoch_6617 [Haliangium ochraceum DSM 14365]